MFLPFKYIILIFFALSSFYGNGQIDATLRGSNINIRECPGRNCNILFQLNNGEKCKLIFNAKDENITGYGINSWFKINYKGKLGFVYGAFLDFTSSHLKISDQNINVYGKGKTLKDSVNVRSCAGLECSKSFVLNKNDLVRVLGKTNDYFISDIGNKPWYEIEFNGKKGFVYSHFIKCFGCNFQQQNSSNNSSVLLVTNNEKGTIIGDQVNVRTKRDLQSKVVFQLNIGAKCTVLNSYSDDSKGNKNKHPWYEIEHNGKKGFVYGKFFSKSSSLKTPIKIWAVVVGIADYSNFLNKNFNVSDLNYPVEDAKRIYQFLKSPEGGNIPDNQIKLLRNSEATRQNILANAKKLFLNAKPEDLIIVYFSGHGGPNFFLSHDQPLKYDDIRTVIEQSSAKKRICIADACYSGSWSNNAKAQVFQKSLNESQLEKLYYKALSNSNNGIALLMSSQRNETSIELKQLGQGLFTYYYIKGLKGAADKNHDRIVTLNELYNYLKKEVSYNAKTKYSHNQTPTLKGYYDQNMPLGVVR